MNATWITLVVVSIVGITKLLTYLLGKPYRIKAIRKEMDYCERALRQALAKNDTVRISTISIELGKLRKELGHLNAK